MFAGLRGMRAVRFEVSLHQVNPSERGLDLARRYLVVIEGLGRCGRESSACLARKPKCSGARFTRCRMPSSTCRNIAGRTERRRLRNAYAMTDYAEAKAALEKLWRQLVEINPSAARSLEEGMEETVTLHRLGVAPLLPRRGPLDPEAAEQ